MWAAWNLAARARSASHVRAGSPAFLRSVLTRDKTAFSASGALLGMFSLPVGRSGTGGRLRGRHGIGGGTD